MVGFQVTFEKFVENNENKNIKILRRIIILVSVFVQQSNYHSAYLFFMIFYIRRLHRNNNLTKVKKIFIYFFGK